MSQRANDLRAQFDSASDALWLAFQAGELTHAQYHTQLDPLEQQLRRDLAVKRAASKATVR